MRKNRKRHTQHSKGKARPRAWHHGRAQGLKDEKVMRVVEQRFEAVEGRAAAHEASRQQMLADVSEHRELMGQLARVAPFAPAW